LGFLIAGARGWAARDETRYEPDPRATAIYRERYAQYLALSRDPTLIEVMHGLARARPS
jgi:hypothetical protein